MFNHFTLDGVENTDVNFNTYVILPSIDALQEFKVQTGVFPAEFGRATSPDQRLDQVRTQPVPRRAVRVPPQRQARREAVRLHRRPPARRIRSSGTSTGSRWAVPIWIPKSLQRPRPAVLHVQLRGVPRAPRDRRASSTCRRRRCAREISRSSRPRSYDPLTRSTQFPGNIIPKNRIHPTSVELLEFYPAPNLDTGNLVSNQSRVPRKQPDSTRTSSSSASISSRARNRAGSGATAWGRRQINPNLYLNGTQAADQRVDQVMVANTRVFSALGGQRVPRRLQLLLQQPRARARQRARRGLGAGYPRRLDRAADLAGESRASRSRASAGFGDDSEGPYVNKNHLYQVVDNFSWTRRQALVPLRRRDPLATSTTRSGTSSRAALPFRAERHHAASATACDAGIRRSPTSCSATASAARRRSRSPRRTSGPRASTTTSTTPGRSTPS